MIARYAGAILALFAFAVAIAAGLVAQNSFTLILSRAVLAMFVFLALGLILGGAAQLVLNEYEKKRESEIRRRYQEEPAAPADGGAEYTPAGDDPGSVRT